MHIIKATVHRNVPLGLFLKTSFEIHFDFIWSYEGQIITPVLPTGHQAMRYVLLDAGMDHPTKMEEKLALHSITRYFAKTPFSVPVIDLNFTAALKGEEDLIKRIVLI